MFSGNKILAVRDTYERDSKYLHLHTIAIKETIVKISRCRVYPFTENHPPPITLSLINPLKNGVVGISTESNFIGIGMAEMGHEYPHIRKSGYDENAMISM